MQIFEQKCMCNVYLICYYLIFSVHFVWKKKKSKFFNAISMLSVFVFGVAFLQISRLCSYFYVLTTFPLYCYLEQCGKILTIISKKVHTYICNCTSLFLKLHLFIKNISILLSTPDNLLIIFPDIKVYISYEKY